MFSGIFGFVFVAVVNSLSVSDEIYFSCYKDLCRRNDQYCVEERQRCFHCADVQHLCNTSRIPRQCDAFCLRLELKPITETSTSTLSQNTATLQREEEEKEGEEMMLEKMLEKMEKLLSELENLKRIVDARLACESNHTNNRQTEEECTREFKTQKLTFIVACILLSVMVVGMSVVTAVMCCFVYRRSLKTHRNSGNGQIDFKPKTQSSAPLLRYADSRSHEIKQEQNRGLPERIISEVKAAKQQASNQSVRRQSDVIKQGEPPDYQALIVNDDRNRNDLI